MGMRNSWKHLQKPRTTELTILLIIILIPMNILFYWTGAITIFALFLLFCCLFVYTVYCLIFEVLYRRSSLYIQVKLYYNIWKGVSSYDRHYLHLEFRELLRKYKEKIKK